MNANHQVEEIYKNLSLLLCTFDVFRGIYYQRRIM